MSHAIRSVAFLTLSTPDSMEKNLRLLQKSTLTSLPVNAVAVKSAALSTTRRNRGAQGRQDAVNRGIVTGDGPDGGIASNARSLVVWGLPGKLDPHSFKQYLKRFRLSGAQGDEEILKLDPPKLSLLSRHLVRCVSVSEAHRLVRLLHMAYYNEPIHGNKYLLRARVIY